MSSAEEDSLMASKKRKLQRACDYCRQKKIKCDGPQTIGGRCSKCISRNAECTYVYAMQKTTYPRSYVEKLEQRLERVERLLHELHPEMRDTDVEGSDSFDPDSSRASAIPRVTPPRTAVRTPVHKDQQDANSSQAQQEDDSEGLTEGLRKLSMTTPTYRYHGKYSALVLIRTIVDVKGRVLEEANEEPEPTLLHRDYQNRPWFNIVTERTVTVFTNFPPDDLIDDLVDLYFRNINDFTPLLHERMFKNAISRGLHFHNGGFGATVLLVCANAARYSSDPRCISDEYSGDKWSGGWNWFKEVEESRKTIFTPAQLYDLQIYVLMIWFLQGTNSPQSSFTLVGIGIRAAIDVGAHRKHMYSKVPTPEEELWKRAFWILVVTDWINGFGLGRPLCIHDQDIDVHLPTECDDEYWISPDGKPLFEQPPDKPSKVSAFNCLIRLTQVLALVHRTLYPAIPPKNTADSNWETRIVTELDSALNQWVDSLPPHLRWDPNRADVLFLTQSATLFTHYYQIQIAVHRPFIAAHPQGGQASFPSLIICTNAARSCIQVAYVVHCRRGDVHWKNMGMVFMSGLMLMLNVWRERGSGRPISGSQRDLALAEKALTMLRALQTNVHVAESIADILEDLMSNLKRRSQSHAHDSHRNAHQYGFASSTASSSPTPSSLSADSHPGPSHLSHPVLIHLSSPESEPLQTLPIGAQELGRVPIRGRGEVPSVLFPPNSLQAPDAGTASIGAVPSYGTAPHVSFHETLAHLPATDGAVLSPAFPKESCQQDMTGLDMGLPDFAFTDDFYSVWATGQPAFGWDDWGGLFQHTGPQSHEGM